MERGRIVWAWMPDEAGRNRKCRTGIILTPTSEIPSTERLVVVVVTSTFTRPLTPNLVPLPWNNDPAKVRTRLRREVVAKCDWITVISKADIEEYAGVVPPDILNEILEFIARLPNHKR